MSATPEDVIRPEVRAMAAYHVPPSSGLVKLDAMENPYPLPEGLRAEVAALAGDAALNRYPDAAARQLRQVIRRVMEVPAGMEIMLGNGSDELIQIVALAVARPGAVILGVEPSFVMYRNIAAWVGMGYVGVPLTRDFRLDLPRLLDAVAEHRPALTFIAQPNNPTGNLFDTGDLTRLVDAAPGLVVVDEAYHPFAGVSFMNELAERPNLLVMRTLSKAGLAGLRLGFLVGRPEWLAEFDKLRLPYNINVLTQVVATRLLDDYVMLLAQADRIIAEREKLAGRIARLSGVTVFPSRANFLLARMPRASAVFESLKRQGVLVKDLSRADPLLADCLRITIGTAEENELLYNALAHALVECQSAREAS